MRKTLPPDTHHRENYLAWQANAKRLAPRTIHETRATLTALETWAEGVHAVRSVLELGTDDLERFANRAKRDGTAPSPATVTRELSFLRGYYRWLHDRGHIDSDPMVGAVAPQVKNAQPRPATDDQLRALWAVPDLQLPTVLGAWCGLRVAEWGALRSGQIDPERRLITAFVRKGGGEDTLNYGAMFDLWAKQLPDVYPDKAEAILRDASSGDGWLLPWAAQVGPIPSNVQRRYQLAPGQISPVQTGAHWRKTTRAHAIDVTPHQLRHACATNMLRAGVPLHIASRILNHSSVTTTMRYVRAGGGDLAEFVKGL